MNNEQEVILRKCIGILEETLNNLNLSKKDFDFALKCINEALEDLIVHDKMEDTNEIINIITEGFINEYYK